ncbi:hypothetical protein TCON_0600 [Astathelohania contejeani]|uniref:Uncharacterized protein n=1 Tax=Astathelohania contejeani TaxID=164912 RepID=A0ABQ7I183_9MICR|nr:hypothetical protein TCON_0600 [Thelohania contejeani]
MQSNHPSKDTSTEIKNKIDSIKTDQNDLNTLWIYRNLHVILEHVSIDYLLDTVLPLLNNYYIEDFNILCLVLEAVEKEVLYLCEDKQNFGEELKFVMEKSGLAISNKETKQDMNHDEKTRVLIGLARLIRQFIGRRTKQVVDIFIYISIWAGYRVFYDLVEEFRGREDFLLEILLVRIRLIKEEIVEYETGKKFSLLDIERNKTVNKDNEGSVIQGDIKNEEDDIKKDEDDIKKDEDDIKKDEEDTKKECTPNKDDKKEEHNSSDDDKTDISYNFENYKDKIIFEEDRIINETNTNKIIFEENRVIIGNEESIIDESVLNSAILERKVEEASFHSLDMDLDGWDIPTSEYSEDSSEYKVEHPPYYYLTDCLEKAKEIIIKMDKNADYKTQRFLIDKIANYLCYTYDKDLMELFIRLSNIGNLKAVSISHLHRIPIDNTALHNIIENTDMRLFFLNINPEFFQKKNLEYIYLKKYVEWNISFFTSYYPQSFDEYIISSCCFIHILKNFPFQFLFPIFFELFNCENETFRQSVRLKLMENLHEIGEIFLSKENEFIAKLENMTLDGNHKENECSTLKCIENLVKTNIMMKQDSLLENFKHILLVISKENDEIRKKFLTQFDILKILKNESQAEFIDLISSNLIQGCSDWRYQMLLLKCFYENKEYIGENNWLKLEPFTKSRIFSVRMLAQEYYSK